MFDQIYHRIFGHGVWLARAGVRAARCSSKILLAACLILSAVSAKGSASELQTISGNAITIQLPEGTAQDIIVEIDGVLADAFASRQGTSLVLTVPFPESGKPVTVTVSDPASGAKIFEGVYHQEGEPGLFEKTEVNFSGQVDGNGVVAARPRPPAVGYPSPDGGASARLRADLSGTAGHWTTGVKSEFVATTEADGTLRPGGSQLDVSNGYGFVAYDDGATRVEAGAGDVRLEGRHELVNGGMASRGAAFNAKFWDGRVSVEAGHVFGSDIVGVVRGPFGWSSLSARFSAAVDVELVRDGPVQISVGAAYFDAERPAATNFNIGQTPDGETNQVGGLKFSARMFEGRLQYDALWAHSEYDNPISLNQVNTPPGTINTAATTGDAWKHTIGYDAWSGELFGENGSLRLTGEYGRVAPFYLALQGAAQADREAWAIGAQFTLGPLISSVQGSGMENNVENFPNLLKTGTIVLDTRADLTLGTPAQPGETQSLGQLLLPDTIGIGYRFEDFGTLNGKTIILNSSLTPADLPEQITETLTVSATWAWDNGSTSLDYTHVFADSRMIGPLAALDRRDEQFGLAQTLTGEIWSLSGRVAYVVSDELIPAFRTRNGSLDWSLSGSLNPADWPAITASYDSSDGSFEDLVLVTKDTQASARWGVSVEFGPLLATYAGLPFTPGLTLVWQRTDTSTDTTFFSDRTYSQSITLNLGAAF